MSADRDPPPNGDGDGSGSDREGSGGPGGDGTGGRPCPRCDEPMYRRHCKYVCPNHGTVFDCSDTFW